MGRAVARDRAMGHMMREEIDQKLERYIEGQSQQKVASSNQDFSEWTINKITGAAPTNELYAAYPIIFDCLVIVICCSCSYC
jgi:hypothetical protein